MNGKQGFPVTTAAEQNCKLSGVNYHLVMLPDSVGQAFREGRARTIFLSPTPTMSGALARKIQRLEITKCLGTEIICRLKGLLTRISVRKYNQQYPILARTILPKS